MSAFTSEFLGTATLVLLGGGCAANANLRRTAGEGGSWLAVCAGWAFALLVATWVAAPSGAHLNPVVTVALALTGGLEGGKVGGYVMAQLAGALAGALLVVLAFLPHWRATSDAARVRAALIPGGTVRAPLAGCIASAAGAFAFVFAVRAIVAHPWVAPPDLSAGVDSAVFGDPEAWRDTWWRFSLAAGGVLGCVLLGLGGASGAVVNPAVVLAGRVAHSLLPLREKAPSEWGAGWLSIVGAFVGAALAAITAKVVWA